MSAVIGQVASDLSEKLWEYEQELAVERRLIRQDEVTRAKGLWVDYARSRMAQSKVQQLTKQIAETTALFEEMKERLKA